MDKLAFEEEEVEEEDEDDDCGGGVVTLSFYVYDVYTSLA